MQIHNLLWIMGAVTQRAGELHARASKYNADRMVGDGDPDFYQRALSDVIALDTLMRTVRLFVELGAEEEKKQ